MASKKDSSKTAAKAAKADKPVKQKKSGKATPEINIELTVAYVGFGGNAGLGQYFYSFAPDVVTVSTSGPVVITYTFEKQVPPRFKIETVLDSDAFKQIHKVRVADDGRSVSMHNRNSVRTLIFFTVLVRDTESNDLRVISCDPQVGNDPRTVPPANLKKKRG